MPQTGPGVLAFHGSLGGVVFTSAQAGLGNWAGVPYSIFTGTGLSAGTLNFSYVGQEIARSFIPEPGTASLLGLGLAALAGAGGFTRRFRKR